MAMVNCTRPLFRIPVHCTSWSTWIFYRAKVEDFLRKGKSPASVSRRAKMSSVPCDDGYLADDELAMATVAVIDGGEET